jgi:hypothetical protein
MSFDLQIDNYEYQDFVTLFQLKGYNPQSSLIEKKCALVKRTCTPDIYEFFYKSGKAIECIHEMIQRNELQTNDACINDMLDKIIAIPSFEHVDVGTLIEKIKPPLPEVVIQSYSNPIAHGKLNTIKRMIQMQNIHLNSCFRQMPSLSTDFDYILPMEIKHVASMRLASIELPNTRCLFSCKQQNNSFKIKIGDQCIQIVIPDGNYTNDSLEEYLNQTYFHTTLLQIHFQIDEQFHTVFESECPFSLYFEGGCGWILGFRQSSYLDITRAISEGLFDAIGDRYIYLSVEDYQYNTNITNIVGLDKSFIDKSILAKVPMNDEKLALIIHDTNPLCKTRLYNGPITLKKIHVKLLDKFGYVIDLNQMDFSFTLELELIYENF